MKKKEKKFPKTFGINRMMKKEKKTIQYYSKVIESTEKTYLYFYSSIEFSRSSKANSLGFFERLKVYSGNIG